MIKSVKRDICKKRYYNPGGMEKTRSASGCLCSCYYRHHILYRLHKMHGAETLSASWNPSSKNQKSSIGDHH